MTYFADLADLTYLPGGGGKLRAVGWLEADHAFSRDPVPPDLVPALERLFQHGWEPVFAMGWHDCSLCGLSLDQGPLTREIAGSCETLGIKNLFVPAGDVIFVAPSLILHYIDHHGYKPPDEFIDALRAIEPVSEAYRAECSHIWNGD